MAFKELVYKILECIKNGPYFRWLRKMGEDLAKKKIKVHVARITRRKTILSNNVRC